MSPLFPWLLPDCWREGGRELWESFALPCRGTVWALSRGHLPSVGRSVAHGARGRRYPLQPRSQVRPAPPPVAASSLSGATVGGNPAVVALALQDQPGAVAVGRVTSLWKLYPYNRRTFRNAMETSGVRIQRKRLNAHWGIDIHRPNALAGIPPPAGVVAIWGSKNQCGHYGLTPAAPAPRLYSFSRKRPYKASSAQPTGSATLATLRAGL